MQGGALALGGLLLGCTGRQEVVNPTFVMDESLVPALSNEENLILSSAFNSYVAFYGCMQPSVVFSNSDLSSLYIESVPEEDRDMYFIGEEADVGRIVLDVEAIRRISRNNDEFQQQVANTITHSMTHACKSSEPYIFKNQIIQEDIIFYGVHGFNLLAIDDNEEKAFTLIEEGVAEALSFHSDPNYWSTSEEYYRLAEFTIAIINEFSSFYEVAKLQQNNDLLGYVRIITGRNNPRTSDLMTVLHWYQSIAHGNLTFEQVRNQILEYRMRN